MFPWWCLVLAAVALGAPPAPHPAPPAPHCDMLQTDEIIYYCAAEAKLQLNTKINEYVNVVCEGSNITCGSLPRLELGGGRELGSAGFERCHPNVTACLLRAVSASGAGTLWLTSPRAPLAPAHLAGVRGVRELVFYDAASIREVPVPVLATLPELRVLRVSGAALALRPDMFRPAAALPHLYFLMLAGDNITAIPGGAFRGLTALKKLLVYNNKIEDIGELAFDGLDSLEHLCLNTNGLRSLRPGVLAPLRALRAAHFDGNRLAALQRGIFTGTRLENITISENEEELSILSGAFSDLPALRLLDLSRSRVAGLAPGFLAGSTRPTALSLAHNLLADLSADLFANQSALLSLDLSYNRISALPAGLFHGLTSLNTLNLNRNHIEVLPDNLFPGLRDLRSVSMDDNLLRAVSPRAFHGAALRELSLARNRLSLQPPPGAPGAPGGAYRTYQQSPFNPLTRLETLRLPDNRIQEIFDDWRNAMLNLRTLDLAGNDLTVLGETESQFLSEGVTVDLRRNRISVVNLVAFPRPPGPTGPPGPPADPPGPRNTFLLDQNPLRCDCELFFIKVLQYGGTTLSTPVPLFELGNAKCAAPPYMKGRPVRDVSPYEIQCPLEPADCPANCSCIEKPYTRTIELDCSETPQRWPDALIDAPVDVHLRLRDSALKHVPAFVTSLDLSDTHLESVQFDVSSTLKYLDLSNNTLNAIPVQLLRPNLSLSLAHNPLECECSNQPDVQRLKAFQNKFGTVRDYRNVTCGSRTNISEIYAENLCDAQRAAAAAGLAVCALLAAALLLGIIVFYYFNEILVFTVNRGYCSCLFSAEFLDADKEFDAFISYAHQDDKFVSEELIPKLENEFKQRVCVHYRDWIVGDLIPMQIVRSVEQSRKTVIVLSPHFLASTWATLEFRAAHSLALKEGRARLVLVVLDERALQHAALSDELRAYIATNTYLKASDARFWPRLRRALPPRTRQFTLFSKLRRRAAGAPPRAPPKGGLDVQLNGAGQLVNAAGAKDAARPPAPHQTGGPQTL